MDLSTLGLALYVAIAMVFSLTLKMDVRLGEGQTKPASSFVRIMTGLSWPLIAVAAIYLLLHKLVQVLSRMQPSWSGSSSSAHFRTSNMAT